MNIVLRQSWTVEDFLAWEARQELRYEFDGTRPVTMTGVTFEHDAIQVNLVTALSVRLRGKPCRVHGNSLKIRVLNSIRYPDAFVICTPVKRGSTVQHEPVVIFEIISKSTARTDRMVKNREYGATASVRRYIMLEQIAIEGMMFARATEGGPWLGELLGPDTVLELPEIGIVLPLAELYADIDLAGIDAEDDTEPASPA